MKKAQAAIEFLMTYGWAILVILIAIGSLIYFGVPVSSNFISNKCSCNYANYEGWLTVDVDNITYYECYNVTKSLNFETQKIEFESISKLFYCNDSNKQLVEV